MENKVFIKGFDKDLKCRGYQFEIGKDYKIDLPEGYKLTTNDLCSNKVFHFCDGLSKVHSHYSCDNETNRYCIIEVLGQMCDDGDKCGSNHIRIVREIMGEELAIAKGLTGGNTGLFNSGSSASKHITARDHDSEKKVREELREELKEQGKYEKMSVPEFQKRYKQKLKAYAPYVDGYYVSECEEDGKPGIVVSKEVREYDLELEYTVGNRRHRKTVSYTSENDAIEKGDPFYITVTETEPEHILKKSEEDYRSKGQPSSDGCAGFFAILFVIALAVAVCAALTDGISLPLFPG